MCVLFCVSVCLSCCAVLRLQVLRVLVRVGHGSRVLLFIASKMVNGEHNMETAGKDTPQWGGGGGGGGGGVDLSMQRSPCLVKPTPLTFTDFQAAAVRHAAEPARQSRHIQQASKVYNASHERSKAKLLTRCGRASKQGCCSRNS